MLGAITGKIQIRGGRCSLLAAGLIMVMGLSPQPVSAYPGFGKRMNPQLTQSCSTCHVIFPKLTAYGRSIREMGYNVPVYEGNYGGVNRLYHIIPAALRGKVEIASDTAGGEATVKELQLLSAGNLWKNRLSWWFHKHVMEDNEIVSLTEGLPHESWVQFNASDALHVRVGMSELPLWFSPSKTKVSEIEYLYYGATTNPDNAGSLFSPQFGIQVNGHFAQPSGQDIWAEEDERDYSRGYNYALAITNGETSFTGVPSTLFARITRKDPRYSAGLFAIAGWKKVEQTAHDEDHAEETASTTDLYARIGLDGDIYLVGNAVNVFGSAAYGKDFQRDFVGGFLGYEHLFLNRFLVSTRFDLVEFLTEEPPGEDDHHAHVDDHNGGGHEGGHLHGAVITDSASSLSVTLCYLFFNNLRVNADYRYGFYGIGNTGTLQLQFAF